MAAVAWAAVTVTSARGAGTDSFALSYVAVRLGLIALYDRVWLHVPEVRRETGIYLVGFSTDVALWVASIFVPDSLRTPLWVLGGIAELVTPVIGWRALGDAAVTERHPPGGADGSVHAHSHRGSGGRA